MDIVVALALGVAATVAAWIVSSRRTEKRYRESAEALAGDLRAGKAAPSEADAAREPPELQEVRHAVAERWRVPAAGESDDAVALQRFAGFLRHSVADPLLEGLEGDPSTLRRQVERVLDAAEDTEFFLREPEGEFQLGSVTEALQDVSRELTREMSTTVKLATPDRPVRARLAPEAFRDAVYLILANAAHFSGGRKIDLVLEEGDGSCRVRIRDSGPGFTEEALKRATEPFFTTEEGSLGLGLDRAARIVRMHAGELRLENLDGQGAEVQILLPTKT